MEVESRDNGIMQNDSRDMQEMVQMKQLLACATKSYSEREAYQNKNLQSRLPIPLPHCRLSVSLCIVFDRF
jgi:hypothetical protein